MILLAATPTVTISDCTRIQWPHADRLPESMREVGCPMDLQVHADGLVTVLPPAAVTPAPSVVAVVQIRGDEVTAASAVAELAGQAQTIGSLAAWPVADAPAPSSTLRPPAPRRVHAPVGRCVALRPVPMLRPPAAA